MANPKILVVEDEVAMAKAIALKLSENGYAVITSFGGQEALELIAKDNYDLIILDLLMPTIDGWDVLEKLKNSDHKVLVLSNLGQREDIAQAKQSGAIDYLVKSRTSLTSILDKVNSLTKSAT